MNTFLILLKKELLEQSKSKKLLILAFLFLFVAVSSAIFAKIMPELLKSLNVQGQGIEIKLPTPSYKDAIDQFIKNISQLAIFVIIFVVAGSISDEKSKKTLELLLVKPVSRKTFVLAKYISYFLSIGIIFALSSLIFYFYTVSLFGHFDLINFLIMAKMTLIYILLIVSVTIFGSSIFSNNIMAAGIGFVGMILFGSIPALFKKLSDYTPYRLIGDYKDIMEKGFGADTWTPLVISILLIFILIGSSIYFMNKQEVER